MSNRTAFYARTHRRLGQPGGPGLFRVRGLQLPAYVQNIAHALLREGRARTTSDAVRLALGAVKRWARGGGDVAPEVRAAALQALAEWRKARATARAIPNKHDYTAEGSDDVIGLASIVQHWRHGWIPQTPFAAAIKAKRLRGSTRGMENAPPGGWTDEDRVTPGDPGRRTPVPTVTAKKPQPEPAAKPTKRSRPSRTYAEEFRRRNAHDQASGPGPRTVEVPTVNAQTRRRRGVNLSAPAGDPLPPEFIG